MTKILTLVFLYVSCIAANAQGYSTESKLALSVFQKMKNFSTTSKAQFVNYFKPNYDLAKSLDNSYRNREKDFFQICEKKYDAYSQSGTNFSKITFRRFENRGMTQPEPTTITGYSGRVVVTYLGKELFIKIEYFMYNGKYYLLLM
jgi:hypothetical protein